MEDIENQRERQDRAYFAHGMATEMTMLRVLNAIALFLLVCSLTLSGYTLIDYLAAHDEFRFGTEVAGWRYYSQWHYLVAAIGEGLLAFIGIIGGYFIAVLKARVVFRLIDRGRGARNCVRRVVHGVIALGAALRFNVAWGEWSARSYNGSLVVRSCSAAKRPRTSAEMRRLAGSAATSS